MLVTTPVRKLVRPLAVALVAVLLGALAGAQQAAAAPAPTIEVAAQGRYQARPDTVVVTWEVSGQSASYARAYAQAQTQAAQVRALLRQQGFTAAEAHWGAYAVQANYDYKTNRVTGFTVSLPLRLEFADFAKLGPLLDAAGTQGVSALRGVSFALKDTDAAEAAAIADGYRQSRLQAAAMARAAGRQLLGLSHASVNVSTPYAAPQIHMMMAAVAPTAQFTPSAITVTARVDAVYRLGP